MYTKRLLLLSALCMTMGSTQVSAQSFLKKVKDKGTKIVKEVAPKPVKDVVNAIDDVNKAAKGKTDNDRRSNQSTSQSRSNQRVRTNNRRSSSRGQSALNPTHKMVTIKLYKGIGAKTALGRKTFNTPLPPTQFEKQPAWIDALPSVNELDNASLVAESKMLSKWISGGKPTGDPVDWRNTALQAELSARTKALNDAIRYLTTSHDDEDDYEAATSLENDAFKRAMQSDYSALYPSLDKETVTYLKSINRTSKEVTVQVYEGNSASGNVMQMGGMWFKVNSNNNEATLINIDNDKSMAKDYTVPSTISYVGRTFKVTKIGDSAFADKKINSVTLPSGLTSIGEYAFARTRITSVNIPSTVTEIKSYAFHNIPTLKSVTVPNTVKKIGNSAFSMCATLTEVTLPTHLDKLPNALFIGCKALTKVTLPQNITKIEISTFEGCKALTHVDLPQSVAVIAQNAFKNTALTNVPVTTSLKNIGSSAFEGCSHVTSISIPSGVEIGMFAFKNCKALKKVAIGAEYKSRVEELPMMFNGCTFMPQRMTTVPACITFN